MANETTNTTLDDLFENITAEAIFTFQDTGVVRNLVTMYPITGSGKVVDIPIYPTVSAAAVAEATDLTNTAVSTSNATITVGEKGIMATLTDMARNTASRNVGADLGRLFGEAIAKKVDTDLVALFSDFLTGNDLGSAGTELTADLLFKAQAILRSGGVPAPYSAVFHPKALFNLKKTLTQAGYAGTATAISDLGNDVLRNGYIGTVAGIDVYEDANFTIDASDDINGGVFHSSAIGLAMKQEFKIEAQRDASLRADELVATVVYGVGIAKDANGCTVVVDSAL
jgi:Phage capsid family